MKKVILFLTLLLLFANAFSQDTTRPVLTSEDYLRKRKSQKAAAWVLLGTGVASLLGSAATVEISFGSYQKADNTESTIFAVLGASSLITSTALFISAGQNRRKAASLTLVNEPILLPQHVAPVSPTQAAVRLRVVF